MYDTPKAALKDLEDDQRFERVALHVLRVRHPELRITGPVGDLGRDGYGRPLFGAKDDTVLLVSLEQWTAKLGRELDGIEAQPPADRPAKAFFATSRSTKQMHHRRFKERAAELGVALEIVDLSELSVELETPALRWVAEYELGVRPQAPAVLVPAGAFLDQLSKTVPGADHELHGRDAQTADITAFSSAGTGPGLRVLVVEGPGGIGKTRVAVQAAWAAGPALVARTAVALPVGALTDIPRDEAVTLVVDDAHRTADLSGVAALVGDSRYDHVRIVLTVRTGFAETAVTRAGLDNQQRRTIVLGPLERTDVEAIVRGHGIDDAEFALAVIELSEGVPLVAHAAASQAAAQGRFGWQDAGSVLDSFASSRLLADADRTLRAAAVALALLTSAGGGADLAVLAGAVTALPTDEAALDGLLADLADAGLADAARGHGGDVRYTVRPHPVGTVLVAAALTGAHGVRLRVDRALASLGLALRDGDGSDGPDQSVLAAQLDVLAGAALRGGDDSTARALGHAVLSLVHGGTDADGWTDALTLARQVAPAAPWLFDELHDELVRQWPPPVETRLWRTPGPEGRARAYMQVALAVEGLVSAAGEAAPAAAARLLLAAVALASPHLDDRTHGEVLRAFERLAVPAGALTAERAAARRRLLLDAVDRWTARRLAGSRGGTLDPAGARTALAAVRPLLGPGFGTARLGTAEGADVFVLRSAVLPADHPDVRDVLDAARRQVAALVAAAPVADPSAAGTTRVIAGLAADLHAESRRDLPSGGGPLPASAARELARTAAAVSEAVASVWDRLPLWARHQAAASAARRLRRGGAPPAWTRPIAQRQTTDDELARVAVVVPVDEDVAAFDRGGAQWQRAQDRRQADAAALGAELPWEQALDLLAQVADIPDGLSGWEVRAAFARAVGEAMPGSAVDEALGRLARRAVPNDPLVVEGMLAAHPDAAGRELVRLAKDGQALTLALPVVWRLPADGQGAILDAAHRVAAHRVAAGTSAGAVASAAAAAVAVAEAAAGAVRSAARAVPLPASAASRAGGVASAAARPSFAAGRVLLRAARAVLPAGAAAALGVAEDDDDRALQVAGLLSMALFRGDGDAQERMRRLVALGMDGPVAALPQVLRFGVYSLRRPQAAADGVVDAPADAEGLVAVLERLVHAVEDASPYGLDGDHDVAQAVASLAIAHPEATAAALARLLLGNADGSGRWPLAWRHALAGLDPAERGPFGDEFARAVEQGRAAAELPEWHAFDVDQVLAWVRAGTQDWAATLRTWAQGDDRQRARAVAAISASWRLPEWPEIVSQLLVAGVTAQQRRRLLYAIEPKSFGPDIGERVKPRYAALDRLSPADHPDIVTFRDDAAALVTAAVDDYAEGARRRKRGYS